MKKYLPRFFCIITAFLVILVLITLRFSYHQKEKSLGTIASKLPQHSGKNYSVLAQLPSKKMNPSSEAPVVPMPPRSIPLLVSPRDLPSADELRQFPEARVVESLEIEGPEPQQKTRLRILETHFKYPFIRTEEVFDPLTGNVITRSEMVADHLLITLAPDQDPKAFLEAWNIPSSSLIPVISEHLYRLTLPRHSLEALPEALEKIHTLKNPPTMAEPDFIAHASFLPNDPAYCYQWGIFPKINSSLNPYFYQKANSNIGATEAWKIRTDASSVIVAILDTGIRYTHEDLAGNMWHNPQPTSDDFYGSNPYGNNNDPMDNNGHGTHCAGIIGAVGDNGIGITGLAWKVQLMACKCLDENGSGVSSDMILSVEYAITHGAMILNCSWGITSFSQALLASMMRARTAGIIIVVAAGNDGSNNDTSASYPVSYELDNIVPVTATRQDDQLAFFSNYGAKSIAIAAPGVNIYSTYATSDSAYAYESGTSMAAPYVTGAFALLKAQFPTQSYKELITKLLNTADKIPALQGKTIVGRLNIGRALTSEE